MMMFSGQKTVDMRPGKNYNRKLLSLAVPRFRRPVRFYAPRWNILNFDQSPVGFELKSLMEYSAQE